MVHLHSASYSIGSSCTRDLTWWYSHELARTLFSSQEALSPNPCPTIQAKKKPFLCSLQLHGGIQWHKARCTQISTATPVHTKDRPPKALSTSKQKLKINKSVSQHPPQGEPGSARAAGTQAAGIGRTDPCQPKEPVPSCNPGRWQPLQPGVWTADAPGGNPFSRSEGENHSQHTLQLAGRKPCPEGSHCLVGTYAPHTPLSSVCLVVWFLLKAFYISHS